MRPTLFTINTIYYFCESLKILGKICRFNFLILAIDFVKQALNLMIFVHRSYFLQYCALICSAQFQKAELPSQ